MTVHSATVVNSLLRIPTYLLEPGPNARGDLGSLTELRRSIAAIGIQQPLLVQQLPGGRFQIIEGHRRHACARELGVPYVLGVLRRVNNETERLLVQLAVHNQRRSFDPIAEARALETLMFDHKLTREEIAEAIGKSDGWVRDRMALLQLTDSEKTAVSGGHLPVTRAVGLVYGRRGGAGTRKTPSREAAQQGALTFARQNREEPHLNRKHPLAGQAAERCDHGHRPHIGTVACGECWEAVIRADAIQNSSQPAGIGAAA